MKAKDVNRLRNLYVSKCIYSFICDFNQIPVRLFFNEKKIAIWKKNRIKARILLKRKNNRRFTVPDVNANYKAKVITAILND